jgi:CheY-like chemotaxis protein
MSLKIMVVDDEPETLKFIKAVLEPLGHQVSAFTDSREAAERAKKQRFEVAFLDVRMPHLDGFELTRRIRESKSNRDIAIVMFTGAYDTEVIRRASKEGVTFFLTKPFNPQRVSGLLNAMDRAMWKEVRRFARLPLRTPVTCRLGDQRLKLESVNVSEGGMLLEPSGGLEPGEEVSLEFAIPEVAEPVNPRARVVRKESTDRVAVEFTLLTPKDRKAIERYISGQGQ